MFDTDFTLSAFILVWHIRPAFSEGFWILKYVLQILSSVLADSHFLDKFSLLIQLFYRFFHVLRLKAIIYFCLDICLDIWVWIFYY